MSKEIRVPALVENIGTVTAFVEEELEQHECPRTVMIQIDVALDEILSNVAHYAYPSGSGDVTVILDFVENPKAVKITFVDSGIPYDPLTKEDPDITLSAQERKIGGLGIYIVKKSMDEVTYRYEDSKNILSIRKNIIL